MFLDGTLGAGGHSAAILQKHQELQTLIGIDMDPAAHQIARQKLESIPRHDALNIRQVEVRVFMIR